MTEAGEFEGWAIVELMGHRVRPGYAKEVELAGGKMLRIDIPLEAGAVTEFYGAAAIYAIRPCSEDMAVTEARRWGDNRPVRPISYREPEQLSASGHDDEFEEATL